MLVIDSGDASLLPLNMVIILENLHPLWIVGALAMRIRHGQRSGVLLARILCSK